MKIHISKLAELRRIEEAFASSIAQTRPPNRRGLGVRGRSEQLKRYYLETR